MKDYELDKRQYVIAGVAIAIVAIYIIRLFTLQIMSDDYKKNADSNAFLKKVEFPSRGIIYDRNGKTLVFNQPSYDIMVIVNEQRSRLDTIELCKALNITREYFIKRMKDIQDRSKNPGYSSYTQQLFMSQLSDQEFSVFQEKAYKFPGFYIQRRSIRQYEYPNAALLLGDVAEVSPEDIKEDEYYQPGDYIGKVGVERSYERHQRCENPAPGQLWTHTRQFSKRKIRHQAYSRQETHSRHRHRASAVGRTSAGGEVGQYRSHRTLHR